MLTIFMPSLWRPWFRVRRSFLIRRLRIQFLFNPYYDLKENDVENYALIKCATLRKIAHSMVKAIFVSATPELFTLLNKLLYQHYEKIALRQKLRNSDFHTSFIEYLSGSSAIPATQQSTSSGAPKKQATKSKPMAKSSLATKAGSLSATIKQTAKNDKKVPSPPIITAVTQVHKQAEQNEPKKKEVSPQKPKQREKEVEEFVDYFPSTPTPKKTVAEVTELTSDVASYFEYSSDGIRAPKQNLKKGTHELLLKHANENGFPFLLEEKFYNFLVENEVDPSSFASHNPLWKEASKKFLLRTKRLDCVFGCLLILVFYL